MSQSLAAASTIAPVVLPSRLSAPRAAAHEKSIGDVGTIGGWALVEPAGTGAFAEVYRARPEATATAAPIYAVKRLRPEWEDDALVTAMFRREALVGRGISHPHVVPILSSQTRRPPRFVVMPWLEGHTLADRLSRAGSPALTEALWIVRQVAEGLAALEAAGWMHGDVKLENIVVSPSGHATLVDLGSVRRLDQPDPLSAGIVAGTRGHLAPECLMPRGRPDVRSDLYSLGVVLYRLLRGRATRGAAEPAVPSGESLRHGPPDLTALAPVAPPLVVRLLRRLLARDPLRRPQSADELVSELVGLEIGALAGGGR